MGVCPVLAELRARDVDHPVVQIHGTDARAAKFRQHQIIFDRRRFGANPHRQRRARPRLLAGQAPRMIYFRSTYAAIFPPIAVPWLHPKIGTMHRKTSWQMGERNLTYLSDQDALEDPNSTPLTFRNVRPVTQYNTLQ